MEVKMQKHIKKTKKFTTVCQKSQGKKLGHVVQ